MKSEKFATKVSVFLVLLFIAGLIPIALISRYDYPCADDFGFSAYSHIAWQETHSVPAVIGGAVQTVIERWSGWQGTFSSIFVMALQPAVWGETFYFLVPWIMIGAMSASSLYLFYIILRKRIGVKRNVFLSISMLYLIFALECMIDKTQAFFWFNGAAHYMIPHSAACLLTGLLIRYLTEIPSDPEKRFTQKKLRSTGLFPLLCGAAALVGGSNYITGLTTAILFLSAFLALLFFRRKREAGRLAVPLILFFAAFLLNILAPGNSVRQAEMLIRPGVIKSVMLSFYYCIEYITEIWFDWTYLLFVLALLPFIREAARTASRRFSFPCPLLVPVFSYCLLSAMFTPSLYATGDVGGGRIFNIIFLDFLLLLVGNLFYIAGWLCQRHHEGDFVQDSGLEHRNTKLYLLTVCALAAFIGVLYARINPDYFTSVSAADSLISGEAARYGEETSARTEALASSAPDIQLELLQTQPYLLFFSDISTEPSDWKNLSMARYYQKNSISGKQSGDGYIQE